MLRNKGVALLRAIRHGAATTGGAAEQGASKLTQVVLVACN